MSLKHLVLLCLPTATATATRVDELDVWRRQTANLCCASFPVPYKTLGRNSTLPLESLPLSGHRYDQCGESTHLSCEFDETMKLVRQIGLGRVGLGVGGIGQPNART